MTVFRLGLSELRRNLSGRLPRLAMLALAIIPSLYAGLYLFANFDPYGRLDQVPAAVVVQDEGTTVDGTTTRYGDQVADQLADGGGFSWSRTDEDQARAGVKEGRYDAALIIGPSFSADLASSGRLEPQQASLVLVTNDANNYLARTISDQIVGTVRDALAEQVGTEAADTFLQGYSSIHAELDRAAQGADDLADGATTLDTGAGTLVGGAEKLAAGASSAASGARELSTGAASAHTGAQTLSSGARDLSDGAASLASGLDTLRSKAATLPSSTADLAAGAAQVAAGNRALADAADTLGDAVDGAVSGLADVRAQLSDQLDDLVDSGALTRAQADDVLARLDDAGDAVRTGAQGLDTQVAQVDALADGARQVADGAQTLADAAPALTSGIRDAASGADRVASGASSVASGAASLAAGTGTLATGAASLASGTADLSDGADSLVTGAKKLHTGAGDLADGATRLGDALRSGAGKVPDLSASDREDTAQTIGNPVAVESQELSRAGTYGAGLAPFFLSLATWIGAYVTFLVVKPLSRRALAVGRSAVRVALGGLFVPALLACVQVAVMVAITVLAVGVDVQHLALTLAFLALVGITFAAILQALNVYLGAAGQFLGLVLMLTQLVTAGGTFPWQTLPEPLRTFHRFLPMSYSVDALRTLLYGGNLAAVGRDALVVAGFLVVAVAATAWAARRQRVWRAAQLEPELVL